MQQQASVWQLQTQGVQHLSKLLGEMRPTIGIVLGSGLGAFAERVQDPQHLSYEQLPGFPKVGVEGHAGQLVVGKIGSCVCAVMQGRAHMYEGHPPELVGLPIRILASIGIEGLIVTNAAGGVNPHYRAGDIMMIEDHINLTGQSPLRGPYDQRLGIRFPDMTEAYSLRYREACAAAACAAGINLRQGVYAGVMGPNYETPAEVRMLRNLGADAVGMSTVTEVIVARHVGLDVLGLSVISNKAAGLSEGTLTHEEVAAVGRRVQNKLCDVLALTLREFAV